jgi:hypothetical protein
MSRRAIDAGELGYLRPWLFRVGEFASVEDWVEKLKLGSGV